MDTSSTTPTLTSDITSNLFKKILKNKIIWNHIVQFIPEININNKSVRYDYYQFPLLLILKTKNQSMLIEKLDNYNKYIINYNLNNNLNNNNEIFKHYINFNKLCLIELFKWNELSIEIFKFIFKLFSNEISKYKQSFNQEIEYSKRNSGETKYNVSTKKQPPLYSILIENGNIERLDYLISNGWINVKEIQGNHIPNFTLFNKNKQLESILQQDEIIPNSITDEQMSKSTVMYNYLIGLNIEIPLPTVINWLKKVVLNKQSQVYGQILVNLLPKTLVHKSPYIKDVSGTVQPMSELFKCILRNSDLYLLKLLLAKYKASSSNRSYTSTSSLVVLLYGYGISVKTLESFQISPSDLIQCSLLELVKVLFENCKPIYLDGSKYSSRIICFPEIALYLLKTHGWWLKTFDFKISTMCKHWCGKLTNKSDVNLVNELAHCGYWLEDESNYIDIPYINQINSSGSNHVSIRNLSHFILSDRLSIVEHYLSKFQNERPDIKSIKTTSLLGHSQLLELLLDRYFSEPIIPTNLNGTIKYWELVNLLIFSMENNQQEIFQRVFIKIQENFIANLNNENDTYKLSYWVYCNPVVAKKWLSNFIISTGISGSGDGVKDEIYNKILGYIINSFKFYKNNATSTKTIQNNFIIGQLNYNRKTTLQISEFITKIYSIKFNLNKLNLNFGYLNGILFGTNKICDTLKETRRSKQNQKQTACNLKVTSILNSLLYNTLCIGDGSDTDEINSNSINTIFNLISTYKIIQANKSIVESLVLLAVRLNSKLLIDMLCSRNQFKQFQLFSSIDQDKQDCYYNQIHFYIYKFSTLKNDYIIQYLTNENYKFKPSNGQLLFKTDTVIDKSTDLHGEL